MIKDVFLNEVKEFQERHGMSDYKFGVLAMKDKSFMSRLKNGRDIRTETIDKCLLFIKKYNEENRG